MGIYMRVEWKAGKVGGTSLDAGHIPRFRQWFSVERFLTSIKSHPLLLMFYQTYKKGKDKLHSLKPLKFKGPHSSFETAGDACKDEEKDIFLPILRESRKSILLELPMQRRSSSRRRKSSSASLLRRLNRLSTISTESTISNMSTISAMSSISNLSSISRFSSLSNLSSISSISTLSVSSLTSFASVLTLNEGNFIAEPKKSLSLDNFFPY